MFNDENFYSQVVGFLKIVLPLTALALMATVFLFARAPTQEPTIPYADIEEIAREPRVSGARMSGVASDGSIIELTARTTRPNGAVITTEALAAQIATADGHQINISAGQGEINQDTNTARLFGLARLETSNGYDMETTGFTADLVSGRIASDGPLEVQSPFGTLTAGQMILETPDGQAHQVMLFQNGVRLVYTPQQ